MSDGGKMSQLERFIREMEKSKEPVRHYEVGRIIDEAITTSIIIVQSRLLTVLDRYDDNEKITVKKLKQILKEAF